MITFSFSPSSGSDLPWIAASVSTRVVSWNEAADNHESVASDAFVIPSKTGRAEAGMLPFSTTSALRSSNNRRLIRSPGRKSVSPGSMMCTLRSICRAISSMCLSWMVTPCERYTCCTSSTRCCWSARTPLTRRISCGLTDPSVSCWPTSTRSPVTTVNRARNDTGYSTMSPSSEVTRIRRTCFSSSSSICTSPAAAVPETWELSGDDAWETLRTTGRARLAGDAFRRFRAADGTSHARSMAFVSMLIVIQGVIIVLGLASAIGQGNLTDLIVKTLQSAAPGPAGKLMTQAVDQAHQAGASNRSTALILGLVAVLISGTILMGQLERGLNRIYGIEQDRATASKYLHAFVLAITAGLLITAAFITLGVGRSVAASLGSHASVQIWNV